jgi:hypothetical protein
LEANIYEVDDGAYAHIMWLKDGNTSFHVGQAEGEKGVAKRIKDSHMGRSYRKRKPCLHYELSSNPHDDAWVVLALLPSGVVQLLLNVMEMWLALKL